MKKQLLIGLFLIMCSLLSASAYTIQKTYVHKDDYGRVDMVIILKSNGTFDFHENGALIFSGTYDFKESKWGGDDFGKFQIPNSWGGTEPINNVRLINPRENNFQKLFFDNIIFIDSRQQ